MHNMESSPPPKKKVPAETPFPQKRLAESETTLFTSENTPALYPTICFCWLILINLMCYMVSPFSLNVLHGFTVLQDAGFDSHFVCQWRGHSNVKGNFVTKETTFVSSNSSCLAIKWTLDLFCCSFLCLFLRAYFVRRIGDKYPW